MDLEDQTIVVTGAANGLGRVMADAFLRAGGNVALADLPGSGLGDVIEGFDGHAGEPRTVHADVRVWEQVRSLVEETLDAFGTLDVLVNNAGIRQLGVGEERPLHEVSVDMWRDVIETNLAGAFYGTKAALPSMLETGAGRVIFISTGHWPEGSANCGPYVASKFGMEGLARALAHELDGTALQSIVLEPGGAVNTDLVAHMDEAERRRRMSPDVIAEPAVRLAAGAGENGGRYVATEMASPS